MKYVFDANSIFHLHRYYYKGVFQGLWHKLDSLFESGQAVSVREVLREVRGKDDAAKEWANVRSSCFHTPSINELNIVNTILEVKHFQALLSKRATLEGKPVADPFIIAKAMHEDTQPAVVTMEKLKPNAAKIPNVCEHFKVDCLNLEEFMEKEDWLF